jgi:hypothetical protein
MQRVLVCSAPSITVIVYLFIYLSWVYLTMLFVAQTIQHSTAAQSVNHWEMMWKKANVAKSNVPLYMHGWTEENY